MVKLGGQVKINKCNAVEWDEQAKEKGREGLV